MGRRLANDNVLMLPDDFTDQDFLLKLWRLFGVIAKSANTLLMPETKSTTRLILYDVLSAI